MKILDVLVSGKSAPSWLDVALIVAVCIQIGLCVNNLFIKGAAPGHQPSLWHASYLIGLLLLLALFVVRLFLQLRQLRHVRAARRQIDAMVGMFASVRHELNNDMQVIVGNAQLAEALLESGSSAMRPVSNIAMAASDAVDRIEQLSAFNVAVRQSWNAVDLNASLCDIAARLTSRLPPIVTLRLDNGRLPTRITANRYLLELSLSHLATQAAYSMPHGGEIIVRTAELGSGDGDRSQPSVRMDIFIVRALSQTGVELQTVEDAKQSPYVNAHNFNEKLDTVKALLERSGARCVAVNNTSDETRISLTFTAECTSVKKVPAPVLEETFS